MITVQDRIEVAGDRLEQLMQLFRDAYIDLAARRGLQFIEFRVSPPVQLLQGVNTLWLRWQVADVGSWWAMRAQSGTAAVSRFWDAVDALCESRTREYLSEDTAGVLPQPVDTREWSIATRGHRETAQLSVKDGLTEEQRRTLESLLQEAATQLPGLELASLSANLAPEYAAGHYTWDLLYPDRDTAVQARRSAPWTTAICEALTRFCNTCHALQLDTIAAGVRRPDLAGGIKRTAYFRMLPGIPDGKARRFEQDLLEMPGQIPQILNWRLSRATALPWHTAAGAPWTYVWEQEYEQLDDLLGPYMAHPHHWGHIDRWFDPESGVQAVDTELSHAFCYLDSSILGREIQ